MNATAKYAIFAVMLVASGISSSFAKTTPATAPAAKEVQVSDAVLSKAVLEALDNAAESGKYEQLRDLVNRAVIERLACGGTENLTALNDMVYVLRACDYLPLTETENSDSSGKKAVKLDKWLVEHRDVSRLLFRAMSNVNNFMSAIENFRTLLTEEEEAVLEYPDLAVAFATAQPLDFRKDKRSKMATMVESFRWYTESGVPLRYNLKKMPYELSWYLADSRLSVEERRWAAAKYAKMGNPAKSYHYLEYDYGHYEKGKDKKIESLDFTLPNLLKVGGVCIEQSYYASQVCKTLGIPASIVIGRGASGMGHAWVAALKLTAGGKRAEWDSNTGRYAAHRYYTGDVRAPTGRTILDSELELSGAAAQLPLKRREQADTAVILAQIATSAMGTDVMEKPSAIMELTAGHRPENSKNSSGRPKPHRDIDIKLVETLLRKSIELNLAHKPAWDYIAELRNTGTLPVDDLDKFFDVLVTRTAQQYPDYSCRMVLRIAPTIEDDKHREKVYHRARRVYAHRPDLQGKILIALAEHYKKLDNLPGALNTYEQAALRTANFGPVMVRAAQGAEKILLNKNRPDLAIRMYRKLWAKTTAKKTAYRQYTSHYRIGKRLAELLAAEGHAKSAEQVREKIGE